MKEWQKGYTKDQLKDWESKFSSFNDQCISPFMPVRTRSLAQDLSDGYIKELSGVCFREKTVSKSKSIKIYTKHSDLLSVAEEGDIFIDRVALNGDKAEKSLSTYLKSVVSSVWVCVLETDTKIQSILKKIGFDRVGATFNSFGDSTVIFYLDKSDDVFFEKEHHKVIDIERAVASHFTEKNYDVSGVADRIRSLGFSNHYSNYNTGGWSALSLRGYLSDPSFIIKPSEMKEKWHLQHQDKDFFLQDTELRALLDVEDMLSDLCSDPTRFHRIRVMKLGANSTIERHTDQVDPDIGVKVGTLPRFHIPIITNEDCKFQVWGLNGMREFHMEQGSLWYLDTRKPHRVVNGGSDRYHLVIDIMADEKMVNWIKKSKLVL